MCACGCMCVHVCVCMRTSPSLCKTVLYLCHCNILPSLRNQIKSILEEAQHHHTETKSCLVMIHEKETFSFILLLRLFPLQDLFHLKNVKYI